MIKTVYGHVQIAIRTCPNSNTDIINGKNSLQNGHDLKTDMIKWKITHQGISESARVYRNISAHPDNFHTGMGSLLLPA